MQVRVTNLSILVVYLLFLWRSLLGGARTIHLRVCRT